MERVTAEAGGGNAGAAGRRRVCILLEVIW